MALFAIADLHLSLATGKDKDMDVFDGWENYIEKLEQNWKKVVSKNDTVVIAGDISWSKKLEESFADFDFLNSLPGQKILLKGNHDYWWTSKKKIDTYFFNNSFNTLSIIKNSAVMVENFAVCGTRGWCMDPTEVEDEKILRREILRLEMSINEALKMDAEPIVFLHYPPVYGGNECTEIIDILIKNNIKKCYYGHVHGKHSRKNVVTGEYRGITFNLVSCDFIDFCPILVD